MLKYFPADILVTCQISEKCQKLPEALWNPRTLNHSSKSLHTKDHGILMANMGQYLWFKTHLLGH